MKKNLLAVVLLSSMASVVSASPLASQIQDMYKAGFSVPEIMAETKQSVYVVKAVLGDIKPTWTATLANKASAVRTAAVDGGTTAWNATKAAAVTASNKAKTAASTVRTYATTAGTTVKNATVSGFNTSVAQVKAHPYIAGGVAAAVVAGGLAYVYWKHAYTDELQDDLLVEDDAVRFDEVVVVETI